MQDGAEATLLTSGGKLEFALKGDLEIEDGIVDEGDIQVGYDAALAAQKSALSFRIRILDHRGENSTSVSVPAAQKMRIGHRRQNARRFSSHENHLFNSYRLVYLLHLWQFGLR
jgi:hypothetical protein